MKLKPEVMLKLLSNTVKQRDLDARWRHFQMLSEKYPADEERLGSEWVLLLAKPAGWKLPYVGDPGKLYARNDFVKLIGHNMELDPGFVQPDEQCPAVCDADGCTNTCITECMCGEVWCSRECMKKDWVQTETRKGHRTICTVVFENGTVPGILTRLEMKRLLDPVEYAQAFGVNPKPKPETTKTPTPTKPPSQQSERAGYSEEENDFRETAEEMLRDINEQQHPELYAMLTARSAQPPGKVLPTRSKTPKVHDKIHGMTHEALMARQTRTENIQEAGKLWMTFHQSLTLGTVAGKREACTKAATALLLDERGCIVTIPTEIEELQVACLFVIQDSSSSAAQMADAHVALGWTSIMMEKSYSISIKHLDEAMKLRPTSANQYGMRASLHATAGRLGLALHDLQQAVGLHADDAAKLKEYHPISKCLFGLDRNVEGIQALRTYLRSNPDTGVALSSQRFEYTFNATDPDAVRFCEGMYELAFYTILLDKEAYVNAKYWVERARSFESMNTGVHTGVADFHQRELVPLLIEQYKDAAEEKKESDGGNSQSSARGSGAASAAGNFSRSTAQPTFGSEDIVMIAGLTSGKGKQFYNGEHGFVDKYISTKGKWQVKVPSRDNATIIVLESKLTLVESASERAAAASRRKAELKQILREGPCYVGDQVLLDKLEGGNRAFNGKRGLVVCVPRVEQARFANLLRVLVLEDGEVRNADGQLLPTKRVAEILKEAALDPTTLPSLRVAAVNVTKFRPRADECSICFDSIEKPVTLHCGHTYCSACIDESIRNPYTDAMTGNVTDATCPLCRAEFKASDKAKIEAALSEARQRTWGKWGYDGNIQVQFGEDDGDAAVNTDAAAASGGGGSAADTRTAHECFEDQSAQSLPAYMEVMAAKRKAGNKPLTPRQVADDFVEQAAKATKLYETDYDARMRSYSEKRLRDLRLLNKTDGIRRLLEGKDNPVLERSCDVRVNEGDPFGDGDQRPFPKEAAIHAPASPSADLEHLWATGGNLNPFQRPDSYSHFFKSCAWGDLEEVKVMLAEAEARDGGGGGGGGGGGSAGAGAGAGVSSTSSRSLMEKLLEKRESTLRYSPLFVCICGSKETYGSDTWPSVGRNVLTGQPMCAPDIDHAGVARALIRAGARVEARDIIGNTPLQLSNQINSTPETLKIARMLVELGHANPNVSNRMHYTPLCNALQMGNADRIMLFLELGADPSQMQMQPRVTAKLLRMHPDLAVLFKKHAKMHKRTGGCSAIEATVKEVQPTQGDHGIACCARCCCTSRKEGKQVNFIDPRDRSDLHKCTGCRQTYYCSKQCQKQDWKRHKPQCKLLKEALHRRQQLQEVN